MLYSGIGRLRRQLPICFAALILCGCGNGGSNAASTSEPASLTETQQNSIPSKTTVTITGSANEGGYVTDQNVSMFCDSTNEFCNYLATFDALESIKAIARFGYHFVQWQSNANEQTASSDSLELIADKDISVHATFEKQADIARLNCAAPVPSQRFRTLHLGDSLTALQCWGANCPGYSTLPAQEPERESIGFYETAMASNTDAPRIIAAGGNRSIGTNFFYSSVADEPLDFEHNNYWQSTLDKHQESLENFDAVIVALGSNDIFDITYGTVDMDFIFEYRIKPLMRWLADKPVLWVLPHYSYNAFARGNLNLYAKPNGIACSCGQDASSNSCNLPQALAQCGATDDEASKTIALFKYVHEFRQRMSDLRAEYPNLQVFDPAELIATQSNGLYDLYQKQQGDKIHFNRQGTEWFAWALAYLAQSKNAACAQSLPRWDISATENDMAASLQ